MQAEYMRNEHISKEAKAQISTWLEVIEKFFPVPENRFLKGVITGQTVKKALDVVLKEDNGTQRAITLAKRRFKDNVEYSDEEIGTILHNCLKSTTYHDVVRKSFSFNELEKDILECIGTNADEVETRANSLVQSIKEKYTENALKGEVIHEAVQQWKESLIKKVKSKLIKQEYYHEEEVRGVLMMAIYEDLVKPPGEWDFLLFLADLKLMFNIEVKKANWIRIKKKGKFERKLTFRISSSS